MARLAILWTSFFCAVLFMILISEQFFGIFYDSYEKIFPHVISVSIEASEVLHPLTNNDFGLLQLYMLLHRWFPSIDVFSWGKVISMAIAIASLILAFSVHFKRVEHLLFMGLITILVLMDSILIVGNVRISMIMSLAAFVTLYVSKEGLKPKQGVFFFYFLIVLAIFNRIEIALIAIMVLGAVSLLFRQRQLLRHISAAFILGAIALFMFHAYNYSFHRFVYTFISTERALADQKNSALRKPQSGEGLFPLDATGDELTHFATAFFVLDEPVVDVDKVQDLVLSSSILDAFVANPAFIEHYIHKLHDILNFLKEYFYLIFGFSIVAVSVLWLVIARGRSIWRYLILLAGLTFLPVVIALIADVPEGFLIMYISVQLVGLLMYLNGQDRLTDLQSRTLNTIVAVLCFASLVSTTVPRLRKLRQADIASIQLRNAHIVSSGEDARLYALTYMDDALFRTRLFTMPDFIDIDYLSFGPFDQTNISRESMRIRYGEDFVSLPHRIRHISENSGTVSCSDETLLFFSTYLDSVHGLKLYSTVVDEVTHERVKLVRLSTEQGGQ